ncbi:MAG: DNA metabolism protein [Lachnospiraceae bacterium]|nr:DNA metabolism protein [Lachnospiraceae bacterium]
MEKPVRIYQCDSSPDGILSAVFEAGVSGYGHKYIKIQPLSQDYTYNIELFSEYINVETSARKAENVLKTIEDRISREAYFFVMSALLSEEEDRGNVIYQFVTYGFTIGADITKALQLECVSRIFEIKRGVHNEAHFYKEFLRFQEVKKAPPVLMAKMEPKNKVLTLVAAHFEDRFNAEYFIIYDKSHREAVFHSAGGDSIIRILTQEEENRLEGMLDIDEKYADLWKVFFDSIAVEERRNYKLQRGNLALHYRKYMTEFMENN